MCFLLLLNVFFFKKIIQNYHTIREANGLDPDQAQHFVEPDLGPNYLQRLHYQQF